jgi:protease I
MLKIIISFLTILGLIFLTGCQPKEHMPSTNILNNKTVVLVIAFNGFQDREYELTRKVLEMAGAKVFVASSALGQAEGKSGLRVNTDLTLDEIKIDEIEALVFIGGPGATEYFDNKIAHSLAKEAVEKNKVLAAICIAPEILAKAGLLNGKKATVWSSFVDRSPVEVLKRGGAIYLDQEVVVDGKIVTANGPAAAEKFGQAIVELLKS